MGWFDRLNSVAPALATALGGPVGGVAAKAALSLIGEKFLGNPAATKEQVAEFVNSATPEQLIQLKQIESEFLIETLRINVDNQKDARASSKQETKDKTPAILAYILIFMVGATLAFMLTHPIPEGNEEMIVSIVSCLLTLTVAACGFYHGYSTHQKQFNAKQ